MIRTLSFALAALVLLAAGAADAQPLRARMWETPLGPQCHLAKAAATGSNAELLAAIEDLMAGGGSKEDLERAKAPLLRLFQARRPAGANVYELYSFSEDITDTLVIVRFSDGVRLFVHIAVAKARDGWGIMGLVYNVNWETIRPRLILPESRLEPSKCP